MLSFIIMSERDIEGSSIPGGVMVVDQVEEEELVRQEGMEVRLRRRRLRRGIILLLDLPRWDPTVFHPLSKHRSSTTLLTKFRTRSSSNRRTSRTTPSNSNRTNRRTKINSSSSTPVNDISSSKHPTRRMAIINSPLLPTVDRVMLLRVDLLRRHLGDLMDLRGVMERREGTVVRTRGFLT